MTATDIRYGRRGGRWAHNHTGRLLAELRLLRNRLKAAGKWAEPIDLAQLFQPDTISTARAHTRHCDRRHPKGETCPAVADPEDLDAIWAGRARMAAARRAASQPLDAVDREALRRSQL